MVESFVIQSNIANLSVVEDRLFHFCHECNVGDYYSAVSVATLQAVRNAIIHGNASDDSKQVSLTFGTCRGGVFVEVKDDGAGFDFQRFGNLPADSDNQQGEGIFIMQQLADKMVYSEGGRMVRLEFEVDGIAPSDSLQRVSVLQTAFGLVGPMQMTQSAS